MDAGQSSQTASSTKEFISPSKGTRTLTVREYEQTISELKKENFDVKLKLFMLDEALKKRDSLIPYKDNAQVVVQLTTETDSLRSELNYKDKLLQDAVERAEQIEINFKEIEKKYAEMQSELSLLSELPSKEEFLSLLEEKENLIKHSESLENVILEKDEEINTAYQKVDILAEQNSVLAEQNSILEKKDKKKSQAIQGFVYKNFKEKEMLPDELRSIVISAVQAAKNKNKDDLAVTMKRLNSILNQILSESILSLNESEEKENIETSKTKCLKEETAGKSSSFLSSHIESSTELSHSQVRKKAH